jgi:hypothetical protein
VFEFLDLIRTNIQASCRPDSASQLAFYASDQIVKFDGFGQDGESADVAAGGLDFFLFDDGGEKHNGNMAQPLVLFDPGGNLIPASVGHHDVQDDHVGQKLADGGDGVRACIFRPHNVAVRRFEISLEQVGHSHQIVNQQNFLFCHKQPPSGTGNVISINFNGCPPQYNKILSAGQTMKHKTILCHVWFCAPLYSIRMNVKGANPAK